MKSGFCVLWGRPNAGKSTLLNALLGRKHVIVSPRPQTTRHRIAGVLHAEDFQIVFLDTPGIHEPQHKLGEALVKNARGALQDVECVIFVADTTDKPHDDDHRAAALLQGVKAPVLLALNKTDIAKKDPRYTTNRTQFEALRSFAEVIEISAKTSTGLEPLKRAVVERLPEGEPYFPPEMIGDRSPEFHIEELIREAAFNQLLQEIPHSIAVGVENLEPRANGVLFIAAFVFVERDSQKRIVIGEGGNRIRDIGKAAREEIQKLLGRPVFLDLRVKVREKWRDNEMWIRRFGYEEK
ncbi:MAG TPA: GTPase Era [Abditibacteriaceae bacterium]|jgi:GTP-binding protein Era